MIYLDTCYILKCYLTEHGSTEVRKLTQSADGLASCVLARAEFAAAVHRHRREGKLSDADAKQVFSHFRSDEAAGYWNWFGLTVSLLDNVFVCYATLAQTVHIRTNDAIHLVCARELGFREIYTNDRHILKAASFFSLNGVNVIP